MAGRPPGALQLGDHVRFRDGLYEIAGLDGEIVFLTVRDGVGAMRVAIKLTALLADPTFEPVATTFRRRRIRPHYFEALPVTVRERACRLERHVTEVVVGVPIDAAPGTSPRRGSRG